MKKIGKDTTQEFNDGITPSTTPAPNIDEILSSAPATNLDSAFEEDNDKGPVFLTQDEEEQPAGSMTLHGEELYKNRGMTPANLIEKEPGKGFQDTRDIPNPPKRPVGRPRKETLTETTVRPATDIDLENLDESKIMDMPEIRAASFEVISMLDLKPKDKSMRFRWANYKNFVAGNLARYYALGYQVASIEDVDVERTPVDPSMIEGTQVKYYDIMLIKIPVMRLMQLYKSNILRSVNRLIKNKERGLKEANRQFATSLQAEAGLTSGYNKVKQAMGGQEPVEFYTPGGKTEELVNS
jgi:hypothetical protein